MQRRTFLTASVGATSTLTTDEPADASPIAPAKSFTVKAGVARFGEKTNQQFIEREGISPKLYGRIARFEQAMKLKNTQPDKDWLSVALQTGYTDYQHMVKDFKQVSGTTPNSLLLAQAKAPERLLGIG